MTVSLTGKDTHKVNDRILSDFADGDCVTIDFETDLVNVKKGKNGNTIYAVNETGKMAKVTYVVLVGSQDDKFLQDLASQFMADPAQFTLLTGESTKRIGDGLGGVTGVTYSLSGGIIKKLPGMKDNAEGDTAQALVSYECLFGNAPRTIG